MKKEIAMLDVSNTQQFGTDMRRPVRHWGLFIMRMILGAVFSFSAWSKIMAPQVLADAIVGFELVPESIALEAAIMLIWLELICGAFMILGLWARATVIVITAMLAIFQAGLVSVILRGIEIDCGCFGQFSEIHVGWSTVLRNTALLLFSATLLYFGAWKFSLDLVLKVRRRTKRNLPGWRRG